MRLAASEAVKRIGSTTKACDDAERTERVFKRLGTTANAERGTTCQARAAERVNWDEFAASSRARTKERRTGALRCVHACMPVKAATNVILTMWVQILQGLTDQTAPLCDCLKDAGLFFVTKERSLRSKGTPFWTCATKTWCVRQCERVFR